MRIKVFLTILSALIISSASGTAESLRLDETFAKNQIETANCFQRISDTVSDLWLVHSNRMAFGKPFQIQSPYPDDEEQTENLTFDYNANFPARSHGEYLYAAGLWVGGIKGNDTLVSHAFDYVAPVPELVPAACPEGAFQTLSNWADLEHIAVAYDTIILGDTLFRCQVGDCHDWYPLGIKVTSHSYTWESPPYDRCIIVEYTIQNIDTLPITEGWVGMYSDCDIGDGSDAGRDDISGFIDGAFDSTGAWVDLDVGYSTDMDGDPADFDFDQNSTRGAFGVQVLGLSVPDYEVNFNWWVIDRTTESDWAPRQSEPIIRDLGGSFATAYGDSNKYYVMSHPEVDYNQIEAGLNHPGWLIPGEDGAAVTWGNDTRFVISAGPFDLAPSEEVTFTVAFIAGDSVINNPYIDLWFDPTDRLSVADYYELLDLSELETSGLAAASVYTHGYSLPPPGPPAVFKLTGYTEDQASFVWSKKDAADMAGYNLMQKTGDGDWEIVGLNAADDTTAVFDNLDPDIWYAFAVASVDTGGAAGKLTPSVRLLTGLPHPPDYVKGTCLQTYPVIEWTPSIDTDVDFYRIYRMVEGIDDTLMLDQVYDTAYTDLSVAAALTYRYFVTSVNLDGEESLPSEVVNLVPLTLTSGILAVNANPGNITSNLVFDLKFADTLFARGLEGIAYSTRRVDAQNPLTIYDLAPYSLVIISLENRGGALSANLEDILPVYMANGGKVILILRHAAINQLPASEPQIFKFGKYSFFSKYFMIDSSNVGPLIIEPGYSLAGDLVGEMSLDAQLPDLVWDSVRANQFGYGVPDGLPYCGYLWARDPAEAIYRYQSSDPGGPNQDQVGGIRYKGDDYQFYLLNFPLSLMEMDQAAAMLRAAVIDLGEDFICGDVNDDLRFNIGDIVAYIQWYYNDGVEPVNLIEAGDVDCSGLYDLADILILINFYCNKGLAPGCCR